MQNAHGNKGIVMIPSVEMVGDEQKSFFFSGINVV
jgi:hypothetical protein